MRGLGTQGIYCWCRGKCTYPFVVSRVAKALSILQEYNNEKKQLGTPVYMHEVVIPKYSGLMEHRILQRPGAGWRGAYALRHRRD